MPHPILYGSLDPYFDSSGHYGGLRYGAPHNDDVYGRGEAYGDCHYDGSGYSHRFAEHYGSSHAASGAGWLVNPWVIYT